MPFRLFEFEDLPWFPETIRSGGTDYLRYFLTATNFYLPVTPLLLECLEKTGGNNLVDLCSGGGGCILQVQDNLKKASGKQVRITLSDKFPNLEAFRYLADKNQGIDFIEESVDAMKVSRPYNGFRTLFSGIHHFDPSSVQRVLQDAVDAGKGIAIFDGGDKNIFSILGILLFHPIAMILLTPFFKPFKLSRLFFTYIIPLIPIYTVWDGMVSIIRLYSPAQLLGIAQNTMSPHYTWKAGKVRNKAGLSVTYLIGYPA